MVSQRSEEVFETPDERLLEAYVERGKLATRGVATRLDLASQNSEYVIMFHTDTQIIRLMWRTGCGASEDVLKGVVLVSSSPSFKDVFNTWVKRIILLGEPLIYGRNLQYQTEPVRSIYVGGVRVLG